jgi:hypothetical protein
MTAYRWHLVDPIPFTKSLKAEIEHRGWTYKPDGAGEVRIRRAHRSDFQRRLLVPEGIAQDQPPVPYGPLGCRKGTRFRSRSRSR